MVSNSGTICRREVGDAPGVTRPTSFSSTATSSRSDTLSVFEITYCRMASAPSRPRTAAAASKIASSPRASSE